MLRRAATPPGHAVSSGALRRVLLAGTGGAFSAEALDRAAAIAAAEDGAVSVLQLLRVWGSGLGLPHPGLRPNAVERERGRQALDEAVAGLEARGARVSGWLVVPTRNPTRAVLRRVEELGAGQVVMDAPPRAGRSDLRWSNEPHRVARRAPAHVHLVHQSQRA